jgi:hypothetical protein
VVKEEVVEVVVKDVEQAADDGKTSPETTLVITLLRPGHIGPWIFSCPGMKNEMKYTCPGF